MAKVGSFPEISGNFVPLPEAVLNVLLSGELSREEMLVTLYLGRLTYAFDHDRTFIGLEQIARGTGLAAQVAADALAMAIERGTVLPFVTEGAGRFYLLDTDQNRRIANVLDEPVASAPAAAAPAATLSPPPRMETSWPPRPQQAPAASQPAPARPHPVAPPAPAPSPAPDEPRTPHPGPMVRGVPRKVLERIVEIIGRDLTRDETERLADLKAPGDVLMKAIDSLVSKHVEIYSSDQVIYEYESIAAADKRKADEARRRENAEVVKQRVRGCKKCNGVGYIFIGVNTIKECDCKKKA